MELLDELLFSKVISYIGPNHYRFIAAINRRLHAMYTTTFANNNNNSINSNTTYINASTMGYAKICLDEVVDRKHQKNDL